MGTRLDSLYPQLTSKYLNYQEIDNIVKQYKEESNEQIKAPYREELLKAFHKYFMKYVSLMQGTIGNINSKDTISFLALFSACKTFRSYLDIHKYIVYICKPLEDEDIYNELVILFISLLDQYKFYPEVSFSRYITQYMRWGIKSWIMGMAHNPLNKSPLDMTLDVEYKCYITNSNSKSLSDIYQELPKMDLAWVANTSNSLFSILTIHERFLIYLSFKEGLGIRQISEKLGRAKDTTHTHLSEALIKLKEQFQKGEEHGV